MIKLNKAVTAIFMVIGILAVVTGYFLLNHAEAEDEPLNFDVKFYDLQLEGENGKVLYLKAELATTPEDRARGLMFRRFMAEDESMLFVFPTIQHYKFWMKNTYIPLDMIFAKNGVVVGFVENAEPHSLAPRGVSDVSNMVLEVNAGFVKKHGVQKGWRIVTDIQGVHVE